MVLYKYCPKCYSLNVGMDQSIGGYKCRQCGYSGPMNQDSIDKINVMKKSKDVQRYAAATSSTRPTLNSGGRDTEIIRKKEDPYNDDIDTIEISDSGNYDDEEPEETDNLESRQSNIMKKRAMPADNLPMHRLSHKDSRSVKERLKEKGGKDGDLL